MLRELIELSGAQRWPAPPRTDRGSGGVRAGVAGDRPGRRLPSLRLPARRRARARAAGCSTTSAAWCSRSRATPAAVDELLARLRSQAPPLARSIESVRVEPAAPTGERGFRILESRRGGEPGGAGLARLRDLRRLPRRALRPGRPPPSLSVHQLHQLRPALHDRPRRPLRPAADDDGRLRDVRALPGRVRGSARPPLPRPAQRLPGVRARGRGSSTRDGADPPADSGARPDRGRRRGCCARARSSPSRASAATTSPASPPTSARSAALRARKHREEKPFALMAADLERRPRAGRADRRPRRRLLDRPRAADRDRSPARRRRRRRARSRRAPPTSA